MKSAQQQLTELQDRHDEFIKLERSIKEVHDMFLEIANLVTQQVRQQTHRCHDLYFIEFTVVVTE